MSLAEICGRAEINSRHRDVSLSTSYNSFEERIPFVDVGLRSSDVIRPCYYILQILGMWKPSNVKFEFAWRVYRGFVFFLWLGSLAAVMCLDFIHYGFKKETIHMGEIMNSVPTCLNLLCPFIFTVYYFNRGQFLELVYSVQNVSHEWQQKLNRIARWYTLMSASLWALGAVFFIIHWLPFFSELWHYAVYITVVVYATGWWATWLSVYGFVCHVHSLQIDTVIGQMKSHELKPTEILKKHHQLQTSLETTQADFNIVISFALAYHVIDVITFSFAYFSSSFGENYKLWQYAGGVLFDLVSIVVKLYPPSVVAAAVHRIVVQASKRCQLKVTSWTADLPVEDIQLFQYMALCESDMGLKILGIRITVDLTMKILMTLMTGAVSFVAFVIPKLQ